VATSRAIDSRRTALAQAVVARQYARQPGLRERYGDQGQARCVQDTAYHLAYLASALAVSSPALFADYIAWAKVVLASRNVRTEDYATGLACLRDVLREQLSDEGGRLTAEYIDAAVAPLPRVPADPPSLLGEGNPLEGLARQFLQALLNRDRHAAGRLILGAVGAGVPIRDVYLQVFQRTQREVGRLWQTNRVGVAQEHYCTAATQLIMSQLYPRLCAAEKTGRRLVAAAAADELHEVGLRIVADLFELEGWDTLYLGGNMPTPGVVQAVVGHKADLLLISATMTFHLPAVAGMIAAVRSSEECHGVVILAGGYPFNVEPDLWRRVGADSGGADAGEALEAARRLFSPGGPRRLNGKPTRPAPLPQGGRPPPASEEGGALYDELSRLNNELVTGQRELARKNAELERLTQADRRKDEFLAMLSHELRNPLAPVRHGLELLKQLGREDTLSEQVRTIMERQVRHLTRLVDDLLDVARITHGQLRLRREPVSVSAAVKGAVEISRPVIEARYHELTVSLPRRPVRLEADPARVTQILTNLRDNAAKYTAKGGHIGLSAEREGDEAVFRVRDSGQGIAAERLPRLFEPFQQADREEGSLGISLALVRRLAQLHGGSVDAFSDGPGRGSEFVVRLPALPEGQEGGEAGGSAGRITPAVIIPRRKILVVDDNVDAAKSLAMMLRLDGHEVRVAYDGHKAIQAVAEHPPEVILLDIGMPDLDGYAVARRLRTQPALGNVLLVAITGYDHEGDRRHAKECGFDFYLVKPVEPDALREVLAHGQRAGR
jgi:signal transduction histidine kinase/ActR/RegA family two-component response regulator/methylmalonyl-CoA mutase cobalamin-binding subunit